MDINWEQARQWDELAGVRSAPWSSFFRRARSPFERDLAGDLLNAPFGESSVHFLLHPDTHVRALGSLRLVPPSNSKQQHSVTSHAELMAEEGNFSMHARASTEADSPLALDFRAGTVETPAFLFGSVAQTKTGGADVALDGGFNLARCMLTASGRFLPTKDYLSAAVVVPLGSRLRVSAIASAIPVPDYYRYADRRFDVCLDAGVSYGSVDVDNKIRYQMSARTRESFRFVRGAYVQEHIYNGRRVSVGGDFELERVPESERTAADNDAGPIKRTLRLGGSWELANNLQLYGRIDSRGSAGVAAAVSMIPLPFMWLRVIASAQATVQRPQDVVIGLSVTFTQRPYVSNNKPKSTPKNGGSEKQA